MSESSRPISGTGASAALGRLSPGAAGEFAGAAFVLALAGAAMWLLATTLASGQASEQPSGTATTTTTTPGTTQDRAWADDATAVEPRIFIVATEERAAEIRRDLAGETNLRALLSEAPRSAEVITAASDVEAEALAATINDQANMHGIAPMAAIVAR